MDKQKRKTQEQLENDLKEKKKVVKK